MEKRCNSSSFGNGKIFGARRRGWSVSSWLGSDSSIFLRIPSRVLLLPVSNRTCWAKSSSLLALDRENRTVLWNHVLWLESVVNPISDRSSWQLNPIFPIIFVSVIVRKEGPAPSCSRIVALSFSTLCLRISQFYFSMGGKAREGI